MPARMVATASSAAVIGRSGMRGSFHVWLAAVVEAAEVGPGAPARAHPAAGPVAAAAPPAGAGAAGADAEGEQPAGGRVGQDGNGQQEGCGGHGGVSLDRVGAGCGHGAWLVVGGAGAAGSATRAGDA